MNEKLRMLNYVFLLMLFVNFSVSGRSYSYAVVISSEAYSDNGWKLVADSLVNKHSNKGNAKIFVWEKSVTEIKSSLAEFRPDYIGFIARPATECNVSFVVTVSQFTRALDSDPYGDAIWGIITGYSSTDALRAISSSLTIKNVLCASGNLTYEPPIQRFYEAIGITCDSYTKTDYIFANGNGKVYTENKRPDNEQDRIKIISKWLEADSINHTVAQQGKVGGPIDCIVTGGHGFVNTWQCHYPDVGTEGYMQSSGGKLYGKPYSGNLIEINTNTPRIYWCLNNCLMGNPNEKDNFVYGAFGSGGAVQMFGFVNNASLGNEFMTWGVYDRITKRAGDYTVPQGFFLSNNNALFEILNGGRMINTALVKPFMDSTVFYGDPAGDVKFYNFGNSAKAFKSEIVYTESTSNMAEFTYTYTMLAHDLEHGTGYCYNFRPVDLLPVRIDPSTVKITHNDGNKAEITDNLVIWEMLLQNEKLTKGDSKKLVWTAKIVGKTEINKSNYNINIVRKKPLLYVNTIKNGVVAKVNNFPLGNLQMKIVDLTGKVCYFDRFVCDGEKTQILKTNMVLGSGVYIMVLEHKSLKTSTRFFVK